MKQSLVALMLAGVTALAQASLAEDQNRLPDDAIARVGDQVVTFGQVNTMLNSSAVVGVSIPALGTPERDTVRIALLDKIVSANLVYLDARRQGVDQRPGYLQDIRRFENGILSGLYRQRMLTGDVTVTEDEIRAFFEDSAAPGTELTEEAKAQIEAALRKRKVEERRVGMPGRMQALRESVGVTIHEENIQSEGDSRRPEDAAVARVGDETMTWGELRSGLVAAGKGAVQRDILAMENEGRLAALNAEIDTRVLARKARGAGMDRDPVYLRRVAEYKKTRLINLHRADLARRFQPTEDELAAYFEANKAQITVPEARKVQMVVLKTEAEALEIKGKIESGEMTLFLAARDYSIDPTAKQNLGEIGWVVPGEGIPALSEAVFMQDLGEIGGPVETPAGWHLLKVLDVRDAQYTSLYQPRTRKEVQRRFIHQKLADYVVRLRREEFAVEVFEDNLVRLAQAEADWVRSLNEKAAEPGSMTRQRLEEMQKLMVR